MGIYFGEFMNGGSLDFFLITTSRRDVIGMMVRIGGNPPQMNFSRVV